MKWNRYWGLAGVFFWFGLVPVCVQAQDPDTLTPVQDTVKLTPSTAPTVAIDPADTARANFRRRYGPRKATLLSLALPGLGQAYNRRYWKIPIIYAGFGALGYAIVHYNNLYQEFAAAYVQMTGPTPPVNPIPVTGYPNGFADPQSYRTGRDLYRRYRDLDIILTAALWALNVVDANVDAHMRGFDLSDDLALRLKPGCPPGTVGQPTAGVTLSLVWK